MNEKMRKWFEKRRRKQKQWTFVDSLHFWSSKRPVFCFLFFSVTSDCPAVRWALPSYSKTIRFPLSKEQLPLWHLLPDIWGWYYLHIFLLQSFNHICPVSCRLHHSFPFKATLVFQPSGRRSFFWRQGQNIIFGWLSVSSPALLFPIFHFCG